MQNGNYDLEKDDPTFPDDLEKSKQAVWVSARHLSNKGNPVTINPTFLRPNIQDKDAYSDNGDLSLVLRVEVKWRNIDFKSREDFPYSTVIVDVAKTYNNAKPRPYFYMIVNKDLSGYLLVACNTDKNWVTAKRFDSHVGRERLYWECPIALCSYQEMVVK
jgi:hypothetical protein